MSTFKSPISSDAHPFSSRVVRRQAIRRAGWNEPWPGSFFGWLCGSFLLSAGVYAAVPEGPRLGVPASEAEIAAWNLTVYPDGQGLPPGRGTASEGKSLYDSRCAGCHGPKGAGGSAEELAGGSHEGLRGPHPDKTIGAYWPYATTVFDFIRRSMPLDAPGSLNDDQIYAITAYLLYLNGLVGENVELNATTLPKVQMPNRGGFVWVDVKR